MFYKLIRFVFILLSIIILKVPFGLNAQISVDSIINNHLKITGLADFEQEIKDVSIEGKLMQSNIGFPIKIKVLLPNKFRMEMVFNQYSFLKISDENVVWEYNPIVDSVSTTKSQTNDARDFIDRFCGVINKYKQGKASVKLVETTTIEEIEVYKLQISYNGQSQVYFIDKYSYLIIRIDDDFVENKITYYSDYRKVGQYYLPFGLTGYENGLPVMSMNFDKIVLNSGISETLFSKPK
jgi:outer membrane lipoprotein-sorting protein